MTVNQEKLYRREKYLSKIRAFYDDSDLIKVITGIRRCGKSSLMRTIIDELKERSNPVPESNICLLYTSPSPRDGLLSRMPSSA